MDSKSKYIECLIVGSTSSSDTIGALKEIFSRNGMPDTLVSDNASSFSSSEFQRFVASNGIKHLTTAPYTPASNGQAERAVGVIKTLLKKNSEGTLQLRLQKSLLYYRSVPHSKTGISPCVALNGRRYITIRDRINPLFLPIAKKAKTCNSFRVGDRVWALNAALDKGPKWRRGIIKEAKSENLYLVQLDDLRIIWKRHSSQLRLARNSNSNDSLEIKVPWDSKGKPLDTPTQPLRRSARIRKPPDRYGFN